MKIVGLYFSGTGNTKWVVDSFEKKMIGRNYEVEMLSIEDYSVEEVAEKFEEANLVGFMYPIHGSDMPKLYLEYVEKLSKFKMTSRKKAFSITTVAIFSGDGALVPKPFCDAMNLEFAWAYNIKMPCNFDTPVPGFKVPSKKRIVDMKEKALIKMDKIIEKMESGLHRLSGATVVTMAIGNSSRLSSRKMMKKYDISVNKELCIRCGTCIKLCPTKNLTLPEGQGAIETHGKCTACLRCVNNCPSYSLRMLKAKNKSKYNQYKGPENY